MIHSLGRAAKQFSEQKTGIYLLPDSPWMQYATYNSLATLWQERKTFLRRSIELTRGEVTRLLSSSAPNEPNALDGNKLTAQEILERKNQKRLKKAEKLRQKQCNAEMSREEIATRSFYRWEMKENLRERRLMRDEESVAQLLRRKEKEMQKLAAEQLMLLSNNRAGGAGLPGAGAGGSDGVVLNSALAAEIRAKRDLQFTYEQRRRELKDLTIERRKMKEEQASMLIEDELSKELRDLDRVERQRLAYVKEFGEDQELLEAMQGDGHGEGDGAGVAALTPSQRAALTPSQRATLSKAAAATPKTLFGIELRFINLKTQRLNLAALDNNPTTALPIPPWLPTPVDFATWNVKKQNAHIKLHYKVHFAQQMALQRQSKEVKRLNRLETKAYKIWLGKYQVCELQAMENELKYIEAEELLQEFQKKLQDLTENVSKVTMYCYEKGKEELRLSTEVDKKKAFAREKENELKNAESFYALCLRKEKNKQKLKKKISVACKFIDTDSINGFHQRFATELLRERLYMSYFTLIVTQIVNKSEIIIFEKKMMSLQHELTANKRLLSDRHDVMHSLVREMRVDEMLRMKRSFLNTKLFPKHRASLLSGLFQRWVRYYYWNRGHQDAFKLKYETIKRQLDLNRKYAKQLNASSSSNSSSNNDKDGREDAPTIFQQVNERPLRCTKCYNFYLGSGNHSMACCSHSGIYHMSCPSGCPAPGLTALCSVHRKQRWSCCNNTDSKAVGCGRKYHCPPENDPIYDGIMEKLNERDARQISELDAALEVVQKEDYPRQVASKKREQIEAIEEQLSEARKIVAKFKDLKFL